MILTAGTGDIPSSPFGIASMRLRCVLASRCLCLLQYYMGLHGGHISTGHVTHRDLYRLPGLLNSCLPWVESASSGEYVVNSYGVTVGSCAVWCAGLSRVMKRRVEPLQGLQGQQGQKQQQQRQRLWQQVPQQQRWVQLLQAAADQQVLQAAVVLVPAVAQCWRHEQHCWLNINSRTARIQGLYQHQQQQQGTAAAHQSLAWTPSPVPCRQSLLLPLTSAQLSHHQVTAGARCTT